MALQKKARNVKENPVKVLAFVLLFMYCISAVLLVFLAFLLYKTQLSEAAVRIGVILIYIITNLLGGIFAGKKIKDKKFLWGFLAGIFYFIILSAVSLIVKGTDTIELVKFATTFLLCACAGMAGGMIS